MNHLPPMDDSEEQSSNWTCVTCTFINDNSNETCHMCSNERNPSS